MKKINNLFPILILSLLFFSINSCNKNISLRKADTHDTIGNSLLSIHDLDSGDLILVSAQTKDLSGAINRVTQVSEKRNYDHVGLIEKTKDSIFVLHASPSGGSQREEINHFYQTQTKKNNNIVIYRLKPEFQHTIPDAILTAKSLVGKAYNWNYILNDDTFYCSDFIERAFRKDYVFKLIPMNFKNPETGKFDDYWIDFYAKKNLKIPQDEPGTNPNQIAESEKLEEIGPLLIYPK